MHRTKKRLRLSHHLANDPRLTPSTIVDHLFRLFKWLQWSVSCLKVQESASMVLLLLRQKITVQVHLKTVLYQRLWCHVAKLRACTLQPSQIHKFKLLELKVSIQFHLNFTLFVLVLLPLCFSSQHLIKTRDSLDKTKRNKNQFMP
mgnify:CR=1 FL=1